MRNFTELLILGMITWRLTSLLVYEHGPFDIFGRLRVWLGVRYSVNNIPYGTNEISKMILCFLCCSIWVSAVIAIIAPPLLEISVKFHPLANWTLNVLVLSTTAIMIDAFIEQRNHE